jgi:hypothetical protein
MTNDRPLRVATFLAPNIRLAYETVAVYASERLDLSGAGRWHVFRCIREW